MKALAYLRVSTEEQGDSGAGLAAQRAAIRGEVERRGWNLIAELSDTASGKALLGRPGLGAALEILDAREADALVVSKLDRLSRSLLDFAGLMERSHRKGWAIVTLDLGVDTTSPAGELVASVMATFAQFERKLIGQRTREALAARRAEGVRLGRPPALDDSVRAEVEAMSESGMSLRQIANDFNERGVPTAQGGQRWYASTIRAILRGRSLVQPVRPKAPEGHSG